MIKNIFILMSVLLLNVSASVQAQETDQSGLWVYPQVQMKCD